MELKLSGKVLIARISVTVTSQEDSALLQNTNSN